MSALHGMIRPDCPPSVGGGISPQLFMREQSTQGQEPAAQNILHLWREYLRPYKLTLAGAVLGGVIAAISSGFGIPAILQSVFSVIFDGEPLPVYAERLMLLFVRPEELPWLTQPSRMTP